MRMRSQLGNEFEDFISSMDSPSSVAVRLNPGKPAKHLKASGTIPWCDNGLILPNRPNFTLDPLFHAGTYYVQESSSMSISYILQTSIALDEPLKVLDLSAAPGGKSTLINSMLSKDSVLVANEPISKRNNILQQNLVKWGYDNTIITQSDPTYFKKLPGFFDVILVDAPCSGEGLFRKDPLAMKEWSAENVKRCALRQRRILSDIYPSLAPGGLLIYSTCTYSEAENEENVKWLLKESGLEMVEIMFPENWGVQTHPDGFPGYRFYPHHTMGEGFFVAVLKKKSSHHSPSGYRMSTSTLVSEPANPVDHHWLKDADHYSYITHNNIRSAFPKQLLPILQSLQQGKLRIKSVGTQLGKMYPKGLKPSPELALSQSLSSQIEGIELTKDEALDFLSHTPFQIPANISPGKYLIRYSGFGLGWINKLDNGQIRNNYPLPWRILKR